MQQRRNTFCIIGCIFLAMTREAFRRITTDYQSSPCFGHTPARQHPLNTAHASSMVDKPPPQRTTPLKSRGNHYERDPRRRYSITHPRAVSYDARNTLVHNVCCSTRTLACPSSHNKGNITKTGHLTVILTCPRSGARRRQAPSVRLRLRGRVLESLVLLC